MTLVPKHIKDLLPYKPGKRIEEVKNIYKLDQVIKLASNENPLGPSNKAIKAVKKCLLHTHRYPDSSGYKLSSSLEMTSPITLSPKNSNFSLLYSSLKLL